MSLYDDYRNTDYLNDVSFIAGNEYTIDFPIYQNNVLVNISGATLKWALSLYGQPDYVVLEKNGTIKDANTFQVALTEYDTLLLGDSIYLQQMRITDSTGAKMRPGQGVVIIRKAIPMTA